MVATITKTSRIYLAIWRKAVELGEMEIKFKSQAECIAFSRSMYRALLPYRKMQLHDEVMSEAVESLAVWSPKKFADGEVPFVRIQKRKDLDMAESLFASLGMTEADLLTSGEVSAMESAAEVAKSADRLIDEFMAKPEPLEPAEPKLATEHSPTPFYSRD